MQLPGSSTAKLVGFLGTGPKDGGYASTKYILVKEESRSTRFISLALAQLLGLKRVTLFSTQESEELYRVALESEAKREGVDVIFLRFPLGKNASELELQLKLLAPELLDRSADQIVLDITHGFRSFPFFASSLMAFASSVALHSGSFRVLYGAYEASGGKHACPIWDLSPTLTAYHHGFELTTFLKSGRLSRSWPEQLESLARALVSGDQSKAKKLRAFAQAMRRFADDFATIRVGPLLLGANEKDAGSAVKLRNEIHRCREEVIEFFPMLGTVLDQIENQVAPLTHDLAIPHLGTPAGLRCSLALAQLYLECERYSECAVVAREMAVDLHCEPEGAMPGYTKFRSSRRENGRSILVKKNPDLNRKLNQIRNDIEHGGYDVAGKMKTPAQLRKGLEEILGELSRCVEKRERLARV